MEHHDALEQELLAREQQYWNAIRTKDAQAAARLTDDSCIVVGAQGVGELSRNAVSSMLESATYALNDSHWKMCTFVVLAMTSWHWRTRCAKT